MTARHFGRITLAAGGVAVLLLAGQGCTRVKTAWKDLTGPASTQPVAPPADPASVAQGDEASANAPASIVADSYSAPPPAEPVRAPVVNVFGELDGQETKHRGDAGDVAFQQHTFSDEGF